MINGKKIVVSEQIIREALQINDQLGFPTKISMGQIEEIVERMGYEGVFPPTWVSYRELLPTYWRFHAHSFIICISGSKAGADEISLLNTGAIAALATGLNFNSSRYILNEMVSNVEGKRKDKFLMFFLKNSSSLHRFMTNQSQKAYLTMKTLKKMLLQPRA